MLTFNTTPTRPYFISALYEWIQDNGLTPFIEVDANQQGVIVPLEFVKEGRIVLNIAMSATHQLALDKDSISFSARFGGVSRDVYIPVQAVVGIFTKETGQGMFFDSNEYPQSDDAEYATTTSITPETTSVNTHEETVQEEIAQKAPSLSQRKLKLLDDE